MAGPQGCENFFCLGSSGALAAGGLAFAGAAAGAGFSAAGNVSFGATNLADVLCTLAFAAATHGSLSAFLSGVRPCRALLCESLAEPFRDWLLEPLCGLGG